LFTGEYRLAMRQPENLQGTAASTNRLYELNDRALWPLIDARDDRSQEAAIEVLVTEDVKPVIAAILQRFRRMEPNLQIEDLEEISSLAAVRLIRRVRAAALYEEHAIKVLDNYLATLTYNALYDFRRQRYPERHRLKRNLRYLLTRHRSFALWEMPDSFVAGLSQWNGQPPKSAALLTRFSATSAMREKAHPAEALRAIFNQLGHPVEFESLVDLAAELWDVRDAVIESGEYPPDEQPDQLSSLEQREYLETLWSEIRELPDNQRAALLLNLRDSGGSNALTLFLLLNIADVAEVARHAGLTEDELNEMWESLPLDDLAIADRLKLTRQQVINLRKSARMRLARRMAKWK
jgi:hypothetical protein